METLGHRQEVKSQVCEIFENWAEHYATERERLPYFQAQLDIAFKMLAGESGRVLDIGCAGGAEIVGLRARGFSVVGVDLAPRMLQFARHRFESDRQVHFCQADIDQLPFSSGSMNHVICLGVFEFLPDYGTALTGIRRVLRQGGTAVFAIPTAISLYLLGKRLTTLVLGPPWRIAKRLFRRSSAPPGESFHRNLCIPWRYRALLKQHGLEPQESNYSNYFLYPLDRLPNLNVKVAKLLEPLASIPLLRYGASVYLVSARKR
ncbi:MAG: class I SAM-dependent methyltransferase [Acidobacteriaceae bacterium]|nr:class I SAM-dependent methyltransferase [Acidobacteriaceae bacterium]